MFSGPCAVKISSVRLTGRGLPEAPWYVILKHSCNNQPFINSTFSKLPYLRADPDRKNIRPFGLAIDAAVGYVITKHFCHKEAFTAHQAMPPMRGDFMHVSRAIRLQAACPFLAAWADCKARNYPMTTPEAGIPKSVFFDLGVFSFLHCYRVFRETLRPLGPLSP